MFRIVELLLQQGVEFVTVWGFSTDNWKRKPEEVQNLFRLLQSWIEQETVWANSTGVRLKHIGRLQELPGYLQETINRATALTRHNTVMTLNVAFNYSGRTEIIDAVRRMLAARVPPDQLNESLFSHHLDTDSTPDVDLVIRTAGELRLSNFMLWQTAYSEYYFTPVYWPDFSETELKEALSEYGQRRRRLGGD
jgi:undecaprenyl diphosphate synthase